MLLTLSYYTGPMMDDCGVRGCYSTERKETILALIIILRCNINKSTRGTRRKEKHQDENLQIKTILTYRPMSFCISQKTNKMGGNWVDNNLGSNGNNRCIVGCCVSPFLGMRQICVF